MGKMRGKSAKAIAADVAEGFTAVNPLFLKPLGPEDLKELYEVITKYQTELRAEKFPYSDTQAIRMRNLKLQRLHSAAMIIRNFARERKVLLV